MVVVVDDVDGVDDVDDVDDVDEEVAAKGSTLTVRDQ